MTETRLTFPPLRQFLLGALFLLIAAAVPESAHAQLLVDLKLKKKTYVNYETIEAEVAVHNRAGRDVILSGPNQSNWLSFDISDRYNESRVAIPRGSKLKPLVVPSGETVTKVVQLNSLYQLPGLGDYRVTANVYFPQLQQYMRSSPVLFTIAEGRVFWERTVGVPLDRAGGGEYRVYQLMSFREVDRNDLYVRVKNKAGTTIYGCYSLGRLLALDDPQVTLDAANRLNVLWLSAPKAWIHAVVDIDATLPEREGYLDTPQDGRPQMVVNNRGDVYVKGGRSAREARAAEAEGTGDSERPRGLSERPPGF